MDPNSRYKPIEKKLLSVDQFNLDYEALILEINQLYIIEVRDYTTKGYKLYHEFEKGGPTGIFILALFLAKAIDLNGVIDMMHLHTSQIVTVRRIIALEDKIIEHYPHFQAVAIKAIKYSNYSNANGVTSLEIDVIEPNSETTYSVPDNGSGNGSTSIRVRMKSIQPHVLITEGMAELYNLMENSKSEIVRGASAKNLIDTGFKLQKHFAHKYFEPPISESKVINLIEDLADNVDKLGIDDPIVISNFLNMIKELGVKYSKWDK